MIRRTLRIAASHRRYNRSCSTSLSPAIHAQTEELRRQFAAAEPFRHVVIDGLPEPAYLRRLASEFPAFNSTAALNEFGEVGRKAVRQDLPALGGA